jgi:hypothetical protein
LLQFRPRLAEPLLGAALPCFDELLVALGEDRFVPPGQPIGRVLKDLRKTCATFYDQNCPSRFLVTPPAGLLTDIMLTARRSHSERSSA